MAGNKRCKVHLETNFDKDELEDELHEKLIGEGAVTCSEAGCYKTFTDRTSFEQHYDSCHRHICLQCRKVLPSNHLLDIHVLESHDCLFELMAKKKPMFACFDESCMEKFMTSVQRKEHSLKTHQTSFEQLFESSKRERIREKRFCSDKNLMASKTSQIRVPKRFTFGEDVSKAFTADQLKQPWHRQKKQIKTSLPDNREETNWPKTSSLKTDQSSEKTFDVNDLQSALDSTVQ